ncbi:COMD7 protein, partial [Polypterus senegalus]
QTDRCLTQLSEFASENGMSPGPLKNLTKSILLVLSGLNEDKTSHFENQWKVHSCTLSKLAVGHTLMVNQLVDMEWKFGGPTQFQKHKTQLKQPFLAPPLLPGKLVLFLPILASNEGRLASFLAHPEVFQVLDQLALIAPPGGADNSSNLVVGSWQHPLTATLSPNQAVENSMSHGAMWETGKRITAGEAATKRAWDPAVRHTLYFI